MKRKTLIAALFTLAIVFAPVLLTQFTQTERRSFEGPELDPDRYREVAFHNTDGNLDLAGMLFLPSGRGPFPAVVVIHGSGTSKRNNRWYLSLAHYLQDNGVAVLLPDKRGSEQSGGNWRNASMEELATDTLAAMQFLLQQSGVDGSRTGVVGLSQGGWIAPVVATGKPRPDFIVSVVGAAVTPPEQLLFEETHNLMQMGFLPGIAHLLAYPSVFTIKQWRQKETWDAVGEFDALPLWAKMDMPALALFGQEDTNVPTGRSVENLEALNNQNISIRVFAGSGHALEDPAGRGNRLFREDALQEIREFIGE